MIWAGFAVVLAGLGGCGSDLPSASQDKALRKEFSKDHFDINEVPQNERSMVQGFIDRSKAAAAEGKSPAAGK